MSTPAPSSSPLIATISKPKANCIVEISIPSRTKSLKARLRPVYCLCEGDIDEESSPRIACSKCFREFHIQCLGLTAPKAYFCDNCKPLLPIEVAPPVPKPKDPQEIRTSVAAIFASIATNHSSEGESFLPDSTAPEDWGKALEEALFHSFNQSVSCLGYKTKVRSLSYNLKDPKNTSLRHRISNGEVTPLQLVEMSADQLANEEIGSEIQRCKEQALQNSVFESEEALKQILFPQQLLNPLKKASEEQFLSTLEVTRLSTHHSPDILSAKKDSLIPVPLAKCPQKLNTFFRNTWQTLSGTLGFKEFSPCEFSASLVGANCWINREALWQSLRLSSLAVEKTVDRSEAIKWLSWASGKKPLLIFGMCAALVQEEQREEEGECSNFESLYAHFAANNCFGLVKKPQSTQPGIDEDCAKEIYILPWRKDQDCSRAVFGPGAGVLNSFVWADYSEEQGSSAGGINLPPALKSDGFLCVVVMRGQLISSGGGSGEELVKPKIEKIQRNIEIGTRDKSALNQRNDWGAPNDWANQSSGFNQWSSGQMSQSNNAYQAHNQFDSRKRHSTEKNGLVGRVIDQGNAYRFTDASRLNNQNTWADQSQNNSWANQSNSTNQSSCTGEPSNNSWGAPPAADSDCSWAMQPQEESSSFNWGGDDNNCGSRTESRGIDREDFSWGSQSKDHSTHWENHTQSNDHSRNYNGHSQSKDYSSPWDNQTQSRDNSRTWNNHNHSANHSQPPLPKRRELLSETPPSSTHDSPIKGGFDSGAVGRPTRRFLASSTFDDSFDPGHSPKHFKKKEFTPKPFHSKKFNPDRRTEESDRGQFTRDSFPSTDSFTPSQKKNTSTESSSKVKWNWQNPPVLEQQHQEPSGWGVALNEESQSSPQASFDWNTDSQVNWGAKPQSDRTVNSNEDWPLEESSPSAEQVKPVEWNYNETVEPQSIASESGWGQ